MSGVARHETAPYNRVMTPRVIGRIVVVAALAAAGLGVAGTQSAVDVRQLLRDVEVLSADDMQGRLAGSEGSARAREYLVRRFRDAGIQPIGESYERPFMFRAGRQAAERQGTNLVGVVRGTRNPDRYIAVTAHYDHIGIRNGEIHNGADDNASGVAALLALALHFSRDKPQHSLLFAALDAEESGLNGARELVRNPPVPLSAIVLNVNLDMLGRERANRLYAVGTHHYPFLKPYLSDVAQPPVTLLFGHDVPADGGDWTKDSDHYAFHQAGIPFIYFGVEDVEQHHKPTDDAATITAEFFAGAANTAAAAVRAFDAKLEAIQQRR
jgi:Zn-dependent M28 family amino/carboxypeptidase